MPQLLRAIRKTRWYNSSNITWLTRGEIQADPLGDLATSQNTLSVWQVEDDGSNLEQIITALASGRDSISNLDYAVFDLNLLCGIGIDIKDEPGVTPYEKANIWHKDLIELTGRKLVKLAEAMLTNAEIKRISEKEILRLIKEAVANGRIAQAKLKPSISKKLD